MTSRLEIAAPERRELVGRAWAFVNAGDNLAHAVVAEGAGLLLVRAIKDAQVRALGAVHDLTFDGDFVHGVLPSEAL